MSTLTMTIPYGLPSDVMTGVAICMIGDLRRLDDAVLFVQMDRRDIDLIRGSLIVSRK